MTLPDWTAQARSLMRLGYLTIPIKPGHKRPALASWQTARLGPTDLPRFAGHGVGVLTGQGAQPLAALDVDTGDAELAEAFACWCREHLGFAGERVGNAPKVLLVYRAASAGWGKAASAWFTDAGGARHRLEVLGRGQQFVAYHVHPDTARPYVWTDPLGGLEELAPEDLAVLTAQGIEEAIAEFERLALAAGLRREAGSSARSAGATQDAGTADPLMAYEPPVGLEPRRVAQLLRSIDNEDYGTWIKVGASLHHEYEGGVAGLDLWDAWSASATSYVGREDLERRWESFGRSERTPITARWLLKVGRDAEREAALAAKRADLEQARLAIAACEDSIELLGPVARGAGAAADADLALRAELIGALRARFKALTGTMLSVPEARAALLTGSRVARAAQAASAAPSGGRRRDTEMGLAERVIDAYGEGLMYVAETDQWYRWSGVCWRRAPQVEIEFLVKETIRALPAEQAQIANEQDKAAFFEFCRSAQKYRIVQAVIGLAHSDPRVVVPWSGLDRERMLFGCANGAIDLRTGALRAPRPDDRITTITPIEYDPRARAPLFERTLDEVFAGDEGQVRFFQRVVGYSMLGNPTEDVLPILFGSGSNGKSTLMTIIREAFGEYATSAAAETFTSLGGAKGSTGGPRPDLLELRGKRLVHVAEPDEGAELREGLIKSMTGGDPIPARGMYSGTMVEVVPTWVTFIPTNHRPIVKGDDYGIWRRLLMVPFTVNFDADPRFVKDPDRPEKLRAELPGVLRWCVEGALAYQREGLRPTESVARAHREYRSEMDLLSGWIEECCELDAEAQETNGLLWASWEAYAKARGELRFIASSRALGRRLSARFESWRTNEARGFRGLRVKKAGDF